MNYHKLYNSIISRAKFRKLPGVYQERHHIIPRCMGGEDNIDNLVNLTAKEHFLVHRLLVEIFPNHQGIKYAFWAMCFLKNQNQDRYIVSMRDYELAKDLTKVKTEIHKNKIRQTLLDGYASGRIVPVHLGKKMPPEFGKSISKAKRGMVGTNKGIPMSADQKNKISKTLLGHDVSENTKRKISEKLMSRNIVTCPHCGKMSRSTCMNYYHFDNCKLKK